LLLALIVSFSLALYSRNVGSDLVGACVDGNTVIMRRRLESLLLRLRAGDCVVIPQCLSALNWTLPPNHVLRDGMICVEG